jgi:hypothetical protein
MTIRLVQLVADHGGADLPFAEVVQRMRIAAPDATVQLTSVAPFDTIAAGFCVAQLALTEGLPDRIVIHDVGGARREPGGHERFCISRTRDGVLVVGPNAGWSWSFVLDGVCGLCRLDVATNGSPFRSRDLLPLALAHVAAQHPHAVCEDVPRSQVPTVPESAVAYVDGSGIVTTTIAELPAPAGERVVVRIGGVSATAVVAGDATAIAPGGLALVPGSSGWRGHDGRWRRFLELVVGGGSAAERFAYPAAGETVAIRRARAPARRKPRAPQKA